jgi:hypothetical protein
MSFLPGWFPVLAAAANRLTSITQVGSSTSTAATITLPADIQAGDLIVLFDGGASEFTAPTAVTPTGFTNRANNTSSALGGFIGIRGMISTKLAVGSEGSSSITGMNGDLDNTKAVYVFRGNVPAASLVSSTFNGQGTTGNPTSQNVAASGGTAPLVVLGGYFSEGSVDPRTMSPAKDGEVSPATVLYLAYKIYNSSPSDVSVDMDDEGGNVLQSGYIQMAA